MIITVAVAARRGGNRRKNSTAQEFPERLRFPGFCRLGLLVLFETINKTDGISRVFLSGGKQVSAVIVKLDRADSKVGAKIVINAAADDPSRAGAAGANVGAEMGHAEQSVDEEVQLVNAVRKLRSEENVVFPRANACDRFVIAAQVGLQAEPVIEIAGESGFPSAGVGEGIAIEERVADKYVAGRTFMAHVARFLRPAAG